MMVSKPLTEWMKSIEVQRLLQVSSKTVAKLADEGRIGVLEIPGVHRKLYRRDDVEGLMARAIRPATIGSQATPQREVLVGA